MSYQLIKIREFANYFIRDCRSTLYIRLNIKYHNIINNMEKHIYRKRGK